MVLPFKVAAPETVSEPKELAPVDVTLPVRLPVTEANVTLSPVAKLWFVSDKSVAAIVILALPLKELPAIVRAVASIVASAAVPDVF